MDLAKLYSEFNNIDPEAYHALVVHGLAFAIRGHWHATRTLCRSALAVVDAIPEAAKNGRTGREAAYLMAIAERRLARNEEAMRSWARYIDMAKDRENPGADLDPRFASEHLAGEVVTAMLARLAGVPPKRQEVASHFVRDVLHRGQAILDRLAPKERPQIKAWVTRQVYVNVLGIALIAELDKAGVTSSWQGEFNALSHCLRERSLAPDGTGEYLDVYSNVIYQAATSLYDTDGGRKRAAMAALVSVTPTDFPLDKARVAAFKEVGLRSVSTVARLHH
jgi:hypothetical protein